MCDKKEFEALKKAVGDVKHDTGNIRNSVNGIFEKVKEINGRVGDTEKKIEQLEDPRIRIAECIQKDTITEIKEKMLTVDRFEAYLEDLKVEARRAEDITLQRRALKISDETLAENKVANKVNQLKVWLIIIGTALTAIGTLLAGLSIYSQLT